MAVFLLFVFGSVEKYAKQERYHAHRDPGQTELAEGQRPVKAFKEGIVDAQKGVIGRQHIHTTGDCSRDHSKPGAQQQAGILQPGAKHIVKHHHDGCGIAGVQGR